MRKSVKDAFYFTPRERKGIFVLLLLIVCLAFAPPIIEAFHHPEPIIDTSELEAAYAELKQRQKEDSVSRVEAYANKYPKKNYPKKQFYKKKVESKSTWIPSEKDSQEEITPIAVEVNKTDQVPNQAPVKRREPVEVDVNTATPEAWQQLSGIGPSFSQRIVKFRDALGGFHSTGQVAETFGLPPETYAAIKSQLVISGGVRKINVSNASEDALKAHPYISPGFAKQILNYRTKVEPITSDEIFLKLYFMDEDKLKQLKPYIEYSH